MSRGILDTSVLIATDVAPLPGELAISVVSLAELQFGVLVARDDRAVYTRNPDDLDGLRDLITIVTV